MAGLHPEHDRDEPGGDRAKGLDQPVTHDAEEVHGQSSTEAPRTRRTTSEVREASDELKDLNMMSKSSLNMSSRQGSTSSRHGNQKRPVSSQDSVEWDDSVFEGSDDDVDTDDEAVGPFEMFQKFWQPSPKHGRRHSVDQQPASQPRLQTQGLADERSLSAAEPSVASVLTQSPAETQTHSEAATALNVPEPEVAEPLNRHASAESQSPSKRTVSGSSADVGLAKPVEARLAGSPTASMRSAMPAPVRRQQSLTEELAKMSVGAAPAEEEAQIQR